MKRKHKKRKHSIYTRRALNAPETAGKDGRRPRDDIRALEQKKREILARIVKTEDLDRRSGVPSQAVLVLRQELQALVTEQANLQRARDQRAEAQNHPARVTRRPQRDEKDRKSHKDEKLKEQLKRSRYDVAPGTWIRVWRG